MKNRGLERSQIERAFRLLRRTDAVARVGIDAVMQHFTDDSVLITDEAAYHGLAEIRQFYTTLLSRLPKGFFDAFKMIRQEYAGEVGYILWQVKPWFPLATDTFVVRDGKIVFQTFAVYTDSK